MQTAKPIAKKKIRYCQLPTPGNIAGRSSSITNAFFNAIIPIVTPSEDEELEALSILQMDPTDIRCAYCGDKSTEWDHLRPIITDQKPTGFITEIANLVPACGKCNQSKGKADWRTWMRSSARLSPTTRGKTDVETRIARLASYEQWRQPTKIPFEKIVNGDLWQSHQTNLSSVIDLLKESQKLAKEIRTAVETARLTSHLIRPTV
jgi:5-methylcytosine-specific restriction endonuclease McrA